MGKRVCDLWRPELLYFEVLSKTLFDLCLSKYTKKNSCFQRFLTIEMLFLKAEMHCLS